MSSGEQTIEAPGTRRCRICAVEINMASARCPYCGARQYKHQPIIGVRGLLVCLVAVAVAVFVTRAVVDAGNSGLRYVPYRSADLAALVPSGYRDLLLTGPHGTAIAGWGDPANALDIETVQATRPAVATPHVRTLRLATSLANKPGAARGYLGTVMFPGGQLAWELEYTLDHGTYAVFAFDACNQSIAMTVTISSSSERALGDLSLVLPENANPICDGPAFSNRDRADPAVPLAMPQ